MIDIASTYQDASRIDTRLKIEEANPFLNESRSKMAVANKDLKTSDGKNGGWTDDDDLKGGKGIGSKKAEANDHAKTAEPRDQGDEGHVTANIQQAIEQNPAEDPLTTDESSQDELSNDEEHRCTFKDSEGNYFLEFYPDIRKKCKTDGTLRQTSQYELPTRVQHLLCQYMIKNHYFHNLGPPLCGGTLDDFYDRYKLRNSKKEQFARTFFTNEIEKRAGELISQVMRDKGMSSRDAGGSTVLKYKRGYQWLLTSTLQEWHQKGMVMDRFLEVAEIKVAIEHNIQNHRCTKDDLLKVQNRCIKELKRTGAPVPDDGPRSNSSLGGTSPSPSQLRSTDPGATEGSPVAREDPPTANPEEIDEAIKYGIDTPPGVFYS